MVQERLGHSSIKVTMDIYSSVLPTMQRDAVEKLAVMMRVSGNKRPALSRMEHLYAKKTPYYQGVFLWS